MAVVYLYMDDFTSYGAVNDDPADQFARLTEPGTYSIDPNIDGESYLSAMSSSGSKIGLQTAFQDAYSQRAYSFKGTQSVVHVAGRFKWPDYVGTEKTGVGPGANINELTAFGFQIEAGGFLSVFNWTDDATLVRSVVPVVHATSETHIEVILTFVDAEGDTPNIVWNYTVQAYVEGVEVSFESDGVFTLTGQTTNDGEFLKAGIVSCGGGSILVAGDLILGTEDETGGDNTFGTLFVGSQLPISDVSNNGPWVPSTGASVYPIFATMPAGDEYASASAINVPETVQNSLTLVNPKALRIGAVMTVMRAQKVDGGDASVSLSVVSSGAEGAGTAQALTGTMTNYIDVFAHDPATDASWLVSAVDDMNTKLERSE